MSQKRGPPESSVPRGGVISGSGGVGSGDGAVQKRARSGKKKKSGKPARSLLRLFKVDAYLYDALAKKQQDLTADGDSFQFGNMLSLGGKLSITLTDAFLKESQNEGSSGLCKEYNMDQIIPRSVRIGSAAAAAGGSSSSASSSSAAAAAAAAAPASDASNCMPVKVFTREGKDWRLVEDVGDEYHLKVPPGARPPVKPVGNTRRRGQQVVGITISSMGAFMGEGGNKADSKPKTIDVGPPTKTAVVAVQMNDEQIQAKMNQLFKETPSWTAKALCDRLGISAASVKRHLKQIEAIYHHQGECAILSCVRVCASGAVRWSWRRNRRRPCCCRCCRCCRWRCRDSVRLCACVRVIMRASRIRSQRMTVLTLLQHRHDHHHPHHHHHHHQHRRRRRHHHPASWAAVVVANRLLGLPMDSAEVGATALCTLAGAARAARREQAAASSACAQRAYIIIVASVDPEPIFAPPPLHSRCPHAHTCVPKRTLLLSCDKQTHLQTRTHP
jgi:hypothetical protein